MVCWSHEPWQGPALQLRYEKLTAVLSQLTAAQLEVEGSKELAETTLEVRAMHC